jgi:hypothetical protein
MGAWSPAAVPRPALAWWADARRASVRPLYRVPHRRASRPAAHQEDSRCRSPTSCSSTMPPLVQAFSHGGRRSRQRNRPPCSPAECHLSAEGILRPRQEGAHVSKDAGGVVSSHAIRVLPIGPSTARGPRRDRAHSPHRPRHADLGRGPGDGGCRVAAGRTPPFTLGAFAGLDYDVPPVSGRRSWRAMGPGQRMPCTACLRGRHGRRCSRCWTPRREHLGC